MGYFRRAFLGRARGFFMSRDVLVSIDGVSLAGCAGLLLHRHLVADLLSGPYPISDGIFALH